MDGIRERPYSEQVSRELQRISKLRLLEYGQCLKNGRFSRVVRSNEDGDLFEI